eukprot:3589823-Pyramimonas_sp.AAC.2
MFARVHRRGGARYYAGSLVDGSFEHILPVLMLFLVRRCLVRGTAHCVGGMASACSSDRPLS